MGKEGIVVLLSQSPESLKHIQTLYICINLHSGCLNLQSFIYFLATGGQQNKLKTQHRHFKK